VTPPTADGNDGSMGEARSDTDLLARAGSEPELFGILFDRHFATIHRYLERQLLEALAALPHGDRDVVVLIAWEELSYEEVAAALAIPIGTVRSRLNRARRTLRELLGGTGNEPVTITGEPQGEAR
jgi:RNA polymerase sigma factor (sigma-70 family)